MVRERKMIEYEEHCIIFRAAEFEGWGLMRLWEGQGHHSFGPCESTYIQRHCGRGASRLEGDRYADHSPEDLVDHKGEWAVQWEAAE